MDPGEKKSMNMCQLGLSRIICKASNFCSMNDIQSTPSLWVGLFVHFPARGKNIFPYFLFFFFPFFLFSFFQRLRNDSDTSWRANENEDVSQGFARLGQCSFLTYQRVRIWARAFVRRLLNFLGKAYAKTAIIPRLKEGRIVCCDPAVKVGCFR